jgi:hypothetical protein
MSSFSVQEMVTLEVSISYTLMSRSQGFVIKTAAECLEGEWSLVVEIY